VTCAAFGKDREARMIDLIRLSDGYVAELSLVADEDGAVVGHILLSYVEVKGVRRVLELGPLSVLPARQRNGIGSALVQACLEAADARGEPLVLVLGHPGYYQRFGFHRASDFGINAPDGIPDEAFMVFPLRAYDPSIRGLVIFPPAYATDG
jgi:putative acetyltransferase